MTIDNEQHQVRVRMGEESETVMSYGGGVQSTAALVLAVQGLLPISTFLFANVGDDSEHPATLRYLHEVAVPYAATHGKTIIELRRCQRDGTPTPTLFEMATSLENRSIPLPVRMSNGAPGNRACTQDYKIAVVNRWLRAHGATKTHPMRLALGISLDEWWRMRTSEQAYRINTYPLVDRRLYRYDCIALIERAGLPCPPKSSCWFCPFHRRSYWRDLVNRDPALFQRAVQLERTINQKRHALGKDPVFLTDYHLPLDQGVGTMTQPALWEADAPCDSGFCFL